MLEQLSVDKLFEALSKVYAERGIELTVKVEEKKNEKEVQMER